MSANFGASNRQLDPRDGFDIIFCHHCESQWYRSSRDTSPPPPCSDCGSEAVEIVSEDSDPRDFHTNINPWEALLGMASPGNNFREFLQDRANQLRQRNRDPSNDFSDPIPHHHHYRDHHEHHERAYHPPYASRAPAEDSDPEEADIGEIEEHEMRGPNNTYMYRSINSFPNGRPANDDPGRAAPGRQPGGIDPSNPMALETTLSDFLNTIRTAQTGRSGPETLFGQDNNNRRGNVETFTTFNGPRFRGGAMSFTIATGPVRTGGPPPGDFNTIFTNIMGNTAQPTFGDEQDRPDGIPGFPVAIRSLLASLLGREAVAQGDAVHSDEALDRIISMLMESNPPATGPPPATQTAIEQLEHVKVDEKLLGPEGHAECTICISGVDLNDEVVMLPCKHWFHEECVVMWLKQHNTCPVCRHPVLANDAGADGAAHNGNTSGNGPGHSGSNSGSNSNGPQGNNGNNGNNSRSGNNAGGAGIFGGIPGLFSNMPTTAPPGTAYDNASGLGNTASTRGGSNAFPGASGRMSALSATERAQQMERLDATRRRAVLANNRYRSPRDGEQSASDRRRRDSHSPNPGPPFFMSRRYNGSNSHLDEDEEDAYGSGYGRGRDESDSSSHEHPWSTVQQNMGGDGMGGSGLHWRGGGEPNRWDRGRGHSHNHSQGQGQSQSRQDRIRSTFSTRERTRGPLYGDVRPNGGVPSWMSGRHMPFGGDGAHEESGGGNGGGNAQAGSNGSNDSNGGSGSGNANGGHNTMGTGFLSGLLSRLGTSSDHSTSTPRRRP